MDQIEASIYNNAATCNRNVVKNFTAMPSVRTRARPGANISVSVFALHNENQKPGPGTESHFGLLYPNETIVYDIDLFGQTLLVFKSNRVLIFLIHARSNTLSINSNLTKIRSISSSSQIFNRAPRESRLNS